METYIQAKDFQLWQIIKSGPLKVEYKNDKGETIPKPEDKWDELDFNKLEKSAKAKKLLIWGLSVKECNRVSACKSAKEIWDKLQVTYEGTNQVKHSKIDLLNQKYELFIMKKEETIYEIYVRFTDIINELYSLGQPIILDHESQSSLLFKRLRI